MPPGHKPFKLELLDLVWLSTGAMLVIVTGQYSDWLLTTSQIDSLPFFFYAFIMWCILPWLLAFPVGYHKKMIGERTTKITEILTLTLFLIVQQLARQTTVSMDNSSFDTS